MTLNMVVLTPADLQYIPEQLPTVFFVTVEEDTRGEGMEHFGSRMVIWICQKLLTVFLITCL